MSKPVFPSSLRVAAGALAAASLVGVMACAHASGEPITSDQFAPDWEAHAKALVNEGPSQRDLSKTSWFVPPITPRGRYALVSMSDGKGQVIDGYQFEVTSDPERDIHMVVPQGYGVVEAVRVSDIPSLKLGTREP